MSESPQPPVDVAAVLAEIREGVRQRRATLPPDAPLEPALSDIDLRRLLAEVEATRVVSVHWPLQGQTLPQKIIAAVNKVVRRYLRWYINPIAEQQNNANDAIVRTLHGLVTTIEEQQAELARLRARVVLLEQTAGNSGS
ncbi:MAG TPA: hypothetical protein VD886_17590 [Herpetosiphonaceae bacterium]|nr:hypothetical protein [Herpetosiphonaceae bacterium]